jgi:hypothetical protein
MASIWQRNKPATSTQALSAEIRGNFQALDQFHGINLLGDPLFRIWPKGDVVAAGSSWGHWNVSGGAGAQANRETGSGNFRQAGMSCKLTYGSSVTRVFQALLDSAVFDPDLWAGIYISVAAKVRTANLTAARVYAFDGHEYDTYSAYHTGGNDWELLLATMQLDSNSSEITFGVENAETGDIYVDECVCVLGPIPPQIYLPGRAIDCGTILWKHVGTPAAATDLNRFAFRRPTLIQEVFLHAGTGPSGGAFTVDLNHWDGSAWQSMFGATKAQITSGNEDGSMVPDGTYRYRCFEGVCGSGSKTDAVISEDIDEVNGAGDVYVHVRPLQYARPLQDIAAYDDMR